MALSSSCQVNTGAINASVLLSSGVDNVKALNVGEFISKLSAKFWTTLPPVAETLSYN